MDAIASEVREGSSAVIAVAGTKGIGKSGFARLMVNTLLNDHPRVAYLDTDLGQPEFTVPGELSRVSGIMKLLLVSTSPVQKHSKGEKGGIFQCQTHAGCSFVGLFNSGGQSSGARQY